MAAEAVRRSARLALDLMDPRRLLDPLRDLDLPHNLVRRGIEKAWAFGLRIGRAAGRHLGQDFTFLTQIPGAMLRPVKAVIQRTSLVEEVARQVREQECSDPQDLREMVAMRMDLIREVFSEEDEPLEGLQPVQKAVELPNGRFYPLWFAQATPGAFQEAVYELDDALREAEWEIHGRYFEQSKESLNRAETAFRIGYGSKPLDPEDLEREWPERLGRLVREAWHRILERSVDLADHAQQVHDLRAERAWGEEMRRRRMESSFDESRSEKVRVPELPVPRRGKEIDRSL